jgi:hypothetical protein
MENFMGIPNSFFDFDQISTINTISNSYAKIVNQLKSNINNNSEEIRELRAQLEYLKQNQVNNPSNNNNRTLPESFDMAHNLFKTEYTKHAKNLNHVNMYKIHLDRNTVPPSYLWNRFPRPLLPYDEDFVSKYNDLIKDFQIKAINLCMEFCQKRANDNLTKILDMKTSYPNINNIDNRLKQIQEEVNKSLEKYFQDKHNIIQEYN